MSTKATLLKAMISGSFKTADGKIESFDKVVGYLPALDDDKAQQMVIRRYARIWVSQVKKKDRDGTELDEAKYPHIQRIREVFVDSIEDVENGDPNFGKQLSYVGKEIMDMNFEELQDLAAAKDLIAVPLYKKGSLIIARRIAFCEYANKVLGWKDTIEVPDPAGGKPRKKEVPLDWNRQGFSPSKYPVVVADGGIRRDGFEPSDIETSIETEALLMKHGNAAPPATGESRLTLDQLKQIAKGKNISYNVNIGYDALYKRIYGGEQAA
jgi:hypothetical protein